MIHIEEIKLLIVERLEPLNLSKIILFSGYTYGASNKEIDTNLYLVASNENF